MRKASWENPAKEKHNKQTLIKTILKIWYFFMRISFENLFFFNQWKNWKTQDALVCHGLFQSTERLRFELRVGRNPQRFSRPPHSTALPPLQRKKSLKHFNHQSKPSLLRKCRNLKSYRKATPFCHLSNERILSIQQLFTKNFVIQKTSITPFHGKKLNATIRK